MKALLFRHKTNLYVNSNFIFVIMPQHLPVIQVLLLNKVINLLKANFFQVKLFYSQFLYKCNSQVVQSALKSQAGITLLYNTKIVNVTGGAKAKSSSRIDFGVTGG